MHGEEKWYYKEGSVQYSAEYRKGLKINDEIYWNFDGTKIWSKHYNVNGTMIWKNYWKNGNIKSKSTWRNFHAEGTAGKWMEVSE